MAFDDDEELLQDFLVEAGEILEELNEQLVDLEQRPDDKELLNAVFRGFHTIKGGASFLSLDAMVGLCHRAEDIFNALRNDELNVNSRLMDIMLPVLDVLNAQFDTLRGGQEPAHAEASMLQNLENLLKGDAEATVPAVAAAPVETVASDAADEAFEQLVESADVAAPVAAGDGDEISEEEFEALLDQLHGEGKHSGVPGDKPAGTPADGPPVAKAPASIPASSPDEVISEDEFEALLDQLHGQGKHGGVPPSAAEAAPQKTESKLAPESKPVEESKPVAESKPAPKPKAAAKESAAAETTVRVDTKRLDDIMNLVGELVLVRNRMATLELITHNEELTKVVGNLDVVTADLQSAVMKTRMQPIKKVFGRFPRVVRDLARSLKKEVSLEMQGEETDLDKNLVEALADPLVHLVRNAVDHGIESPEDRVKAGKPRAGSVILSAEQEGDHITLTIQDDGKGMDPDVLRKAAVIKGLMDEEAAGRLEDRDCYNLIFAPGFSTKAEISDVSGRGVGMDVVKTRIEQLNGTVVIDSELGRGSIINIQVPLTLAIMPTLMVMLEDQIFALPLASVNEIFHLDLTRTNVVDGQLVVVVRDKALPLFYLRRWLVAGASYEDLPKEGHVVVVSIGAQRVGFVVDQLIGQEEVVIKPLGALLHGMK
ncbi:MAG TPA: chemotaxis protein CheA, partial [Chromatiales bacterium]|nr:chemotaxis protein CheA [Chromatiales bacterium]HEX22320.1 chemotaxis protein CheA [Chromatiales bacterium]